MTCDFVVTDELEGWREDLETSGSKALQVEKSSVRIYRAGSRLGNNQRFKNKLEPFKYLLLPIGDG